MNHTVTLPEHVLKAYEKVPDCYLILSPDLTILTASDAYLEVTYTQRAAIVGKYLFEAFPNTSSTMDGDGQDALFASLHQVLKTRKPHHLSRHRYDVVHPEEGRVERYWRISNTPFEDEGTILYIIHKVEDISGEVTAEQRLAESEALLLSTESVASIGSYEVDLKLNQIRFSDGMYRLFGEEPGDFVPSLEWIDSRSHPDDIMPVRKVLEEASANKKPYYYTRRIYRKDGEMRLLEAHGKVIVDAEDHAIKLIGLVQDVTERKKAEQELQQSKDLLQNVIDAPNIGIAVYKAVRNEKGQITDFVHEYINRASIAMLGEDFTGKLFTDHGENGRSQLPSLIEVLETGQGNSYTREADFRGKKVWFAITNTPLDKDRLVHTWQDITERKESELEILRLKDQLAQTATDKYHSIFNSIDEGFYICEVILDEASKPVDILYLEENPAAVRLTGQRYKGRRLREISTLYGEHWYQTWGEVALSGSSIRMESYSEADRLWISYFVSKLGDAASRQVAVVFQDITERKQSEQQQQYLLQLTDAINLISDAVEIQKTAARMIGEELQADIAHFSEVSPDEHYDTIHLDYIKDPNIPSVAGTSNMELFAVSMQHSRDGLLVIDDVEDCPFFSAEEKAAYTAVGVRSAIFFTFLKKGKRVAHLTINQRTPRKWTDYDITLVRETAERTWAALERAKAEQALRAAPINHRRHAGFDFVHRCRVSLPFHQQVL